MGIVSMSDPLAPVAGGITPDVIAYLTNLETLSPALVGLRIGGNDTSGEWTQEQLGGKPFQFLALLGIPPEQEHGRRFPIAPRFLFLLFRHWDAIIRHCASLHVCRVELALPFVLLPHRRPLVVNIRGASKFLDSSFKHVFYDLPGAKWLYRQLEKYILKRADAVVVVSEEGYRYYLQRLPCLKDRLLLIPPSVDTDLFHPSEEAGPRGKYGLPLRSKLLVYAGRFVREKRVDAVIHSLSLVRRAFPDAALVLIGDGPENQHLRQIAPGDGSVLFMGTLGRDKVAEVISCCDVAVLFSMFEGMPMFVLESLACGLPVVSTNVGDVSKVVIDGATGYVVRSATAEALAAAVVNTLELPSPAENCRRMVTKYGSKYITREVEKLHIMLQERHRYANSLDIIRKHTRN